MAKNLPIWLGWTMYVGLLAALRRRDLPPAGHPPRAAGLVTTPPSASWLAKVVAMAVLLGLGTYYLSIERSRNPDVTSHQGRSRSSSRSCWSCWCCSPSLLSRTLFGRHVYAVGGNAEAARRAGINVARIRLLVLRALLDDRRDRPASCSPAG